MIANDQGRHRRTDPAAVPLAAHPVLALTTTAATEGAAQQGRSELINIDLIEKKKYAVVITMPTMRPIQLEFDNQGDAEMVQQLLLAGVPQEGQRKE